MKTPITLVYTDGQGGEAVLTYKELIIFVEKFNPLFSDLVFLSYVKVPD